MIDARVQENQQEFALHSPLVKIQGR